MRGGLDNNQSQNWFTNLEKKLVLWQEQEIWGGGVGKEEEIIPETGGDEAGRTSSPENNAGNKSKIQRYRLRNDAKTRTRKILENEQKCHAKR
jgi:hypothetical protein